MYEKFYRQIFQTPCADIKGLLTQQFFYLKIVEEFSADVIVSRLKGQRYYSIDFFFQN